MRRSVHQRWRERPRCRARHLTPGRPDGVVHAIVGRAACVAVCVPSSCRRSSPPASALPQPDATDEARRHVLQESVRAPAQFSCRTRPRSRLGSSCTTIAPMMLAPCSASSMLSAALRPGLRPGLRALTTPPRGTDWLLRDGDQSQMADNAVDANGARAYVGLITSVPHGTPSVRLSGQRSAHSADAPGHRSGAHPHDIAAMSHRSRLACTP